MNDRERRVAENELLFAAVNEQILELRDSLLEEDDDLRILCECGLADCAERIEVPVDDYRPVHEHAARFAVRPDHVIPDLEDVIAEHEGWVVVEKHEPVKSTLESGGIEP
jgi:hypothetical protein